MLHPMYLNIFLLNIEVHIVCLCVFTGSGGEADPLPSRSSPEADQQPERRARQQGETHH